MTKPPNFNKSSNLICISEIHSLRSKINGFELANDRKATIGQHCNNTKQDMVQLDQMVTVLQKRPYTPLHLSGLLKTVIAIAMFPTKDEIIDLLPRITCQCHHVCIRMKIDYRRDTTMHHNDKIMFNALFDNMVYVPLQSVESSDDYLCEKYFWLSHYLGDDIGSLNIMKLLFSTFNDQVYIQCANLNPQPNLPHYILYCY